MNNDLISRSALLEKCHDWMSTLELRQMVENAPDVDAVIPVRCAQCKHFRRNLENDTYCSSVNGLTDPQEDDFCSYGEKMGADTPSKNIGGLTSDALTLEQLLD